MNRKFYIIGVTYNVEGLFAIVNSIINHCIYAEKNNYIPIVDMQHYQNQYFKDNRVFKDNTWEYFSSLLKTLLSHYEIKILL